METNMNISNKTKIYPITVDNCINNILNLPNSKQKKFQNNKIKYFNSISNNNQKDILLQQIKV